MTQDGNENRAPAPEAPPDEEEPRASVESLRREAEDNWNKYLRAVAELDNLRKRSAREVDAAHKFGSERLAQAILPVRDSLEAGLAASGNAETAAVIEGQRATLRLLDEALAVAGVREICPQGELFDPTKHEALSLMPAGHVEPNTVLEVVQKGYEMNERLLRAAKVIVARAPSEG